MTSYTLEATSIILFNRDNDKYLKMNKRSWGKAQGNEDKWKAEVPGVQPSG